MAGSRGATIWSAAPTVEDADDRFRAMIGKLHDVTCDVMNLR